MEPQREKLRSENSSADLAFEQFASGLELSRATANYQSGNINEARDSAINVITRFLDGTSGVNDELVAAARVLVRCNRLLNNHASTIELLSQAGSKLKQESESNAAISQTELGILLGRALIESGAENAREGRMWLSHSSKKLRELPGAPRETICALSAEIALGLAIDAVNKGQPLKAKTALTVAVQQFGQLDGQEAHAQIAFALDELSGVLNACGDPLAARKTAIDSFHQKASYLVSNHPEIAFSLIALGKAERGFALFKESIVSFNVARELLENHLPSRTDLLDVVKCEAIQVGYIITEPEDRQHQQSELRGVMKSIELRNTFTPLEAEAYLWAALTVLIDEDGIACGISALEDLDITIAVRNGEQHFLRGLTALAKGDQHFKEKEFLAASAYFKDSLQIMLAAVGTEAPLLPRVLKRLIRSSVQQEDVNQARDWAEKLVELCPRDPESQPLLDEINKYLK